MAEYFSKEGLQKLKEELDYLKGKERKRISDEIAEAASKGDLSENAEYEAAKEEQKKLEARIAELEKTYGNAKVVDEDNLDTSKVNALSTVYIKNHNRNKETKYKLVAEKEANLKEGKISTSSPIGEALMGKQVGDIVEVDVPAGTLKLEILDITRE
jgi:transcription elongation factor GreA